MISAVSWTPCRFQKKSVSSLSYSAPPCTTQVALVNIMLPVLLANWIPVKKVFILLHICLFTNVHFSCCLFSLQGMNEYIFIYIHI